MAAVTRGWELRSEGWETDQVEWLVASTDMGFEHSLENTNW